jgi:cytoskeletal protein CcmA (bactofilin family)
MSDSLAAVTGGPADIPHFLGASRHRADGATVIGEQSNFVGDISARGKQDLLIDGCVMGSIFHGGKVTVGHSGVVIGSIFAPELEVHGVVDAADGEILTANLLVHGTSRIKAAEVTVATGCMNYERGGYMSAQLAMFPAAEVDARIENLLDNELSKAAERRARVDLARMGGVSRAADDAAPAARPSPQSGAEATGSPSTLAAALAAPAVLPAVVPVVDDDHQDHSSQGSEHTDVPRAAQARPHVALVPPVFDSGPQEETDEMDDGDAQAVHRAALGG